MTGMALLPSPWRLLAMGLRRGNTALTAVGAALAVIAIIRRLDGGPKRELVYVETLRAGKGVMVGLLRPGERGGQRRR